MDDGTKMGAEQATEFLTEALQPGVPQDPIPTPCALAIYLECGGAAPRARGCGNKSTILEPQVIAAMMQGKTMAGKCNVCGADLIVGMPQQNAKRIEVAQPGAAVGDVRDMMKRDQHNVRVLDRFRRVTQK